MYKNKFLDKIGYTDIASEIFHSKTADKDKRSKQWRKERKEWGGWDSRVGWNLKIHILENLYTWLKIYYKGAKTTIDLEYHTFQIGNETLTEKECIKRMLKDLKFVLLNIEDCTPDVDAEIRTKTKDCFNILGECLFALWW